MKQNGDNPTAYAPCVGKDGNRIAGLSHRWSKREQCYTYKIRYYARALGKHVNETVPPDSRGRHSQYRAEKWLAKRLLERKAQNFIPPAAERRLERKKAEVQRQAEEQQQRDREELLFENAAKAWVESWAPDEYEEPKEIKGRLKRLSRWFNGRYLDEITRRDVDRWFDDRRLKRGVFANCERLTASLRSAETERGTLSQVYRFLQDRGLEIDNPCLRAANYGRQRKGKALRSKPKRDKVVPDDLMAIRELVNATQTKDFKRRFGVKKQAQYRALVLLAYYTGGRPQSDILGLDQGDLRLPDRSNVTSLNGEEVWGEVRFRNAKTAAGERTVPLHPEAEEAVREILDPDAGDDAPLFLTRKRRWNRQTYRKGWRAALQAAKEKHPEIAGMVARDLRTVFETVLSDAGVSERMIHKLIGHADSKMSDLYYRKRATKAQEAIRALTLPASAETDGVCSQSCTVQESQERPAISA